MPLTHAAAHAAMQVVLAAYLNWSRYASIPSSPSSPKLPGVEFQPLEHLTNSLPHKLLTIPGDRELSMSIIPIWLPSEYLHLQVPRHLCHSPVLSPLLPEVGKNYPKRKRRSSTVSLPKASASFPTVPSNTSCFFSCSLRMRSSMVPAIMKRVTLMGLN
jgi:hypothetical protein